MPETIEKDGKTLYVTPCCGKALSKSGYNKHMNITKEKGCPNTRAADRLLLSRPHPTIRPLLHRRTPHLLKTILMMKPPLGRLGNLPKVWRLPNQCLHLFDS